MADLQAAAIQTLRALLDTLDMKRRSEQMEADAEARGPGAAAVSSSGLEAEEIPDYKGQDVYVSMDGDNIGNAVARAEEADDEGTLSEVSAKIKAGGAAFDKWVVAHGGKIVQEGGDEACARVSSNALIDIEQFRQDYADAVGATVTVGVGSKISESTRARELGKLRGKNQVCYWDEASEPELEMRIANEAPQDEASKMRAAGLAGAPAPAQQSQGEPPAGQEGTDTPVEDGGDQRTSANQDSPEGDVDPASDLDKPDSVQSGPGETNGIDLQSPQETGRQSEMRTVGNDGDDSEGEYIGVEPDESAGSDFGNPDEQLAADRDPNAPAGEADEPEPEMESEVEVEDGELPPDQQVDQSGDTVPSAEAEESDGALDGEGEGGVDEGGVPDQVAEPEDGAQNQPPQIDTGDVEGTTPEGYAPADTEPGAPDIKPSASQVGLPKGTPQGGPEEGEEGGDWSDVGEPGEEGEPEEGEQPEDKVDYRKVMGRQLAAAIRNYGAR